MFILHCGQAGHAAGEKRAFHQLWWRQYQRLLECTHQ